MKHLLLYEVTWDMWNMMEYAPYNHHHHPSALDCCFFKSWDPSQMRLREMLYKLGL